MTTVCWSCVNLTVFVCFLFGLFYTIGYVVLPVELVFPPGYNSSESSQTYLKAWSSTNPPVPNWILLVNDAPRIAATQQIQTSLVIYTLALLSFIGWMLMTIFSGIGFISIPADLIAAYINRPIPIDLKKFAETKLVLRKRCDELVALGKEQKEKFAKSSNRFRERRFTNKYKKYVLDLEEEVELLNLCYKKNEINPLIPLVQLVGGFFAIVLTFSWFLQILLEIFLKGKYTFLSAIFTDLNNAFPLFGVVAYGVFAFYLLLTIVAGSVKFAGRFFLITLHPMKLNGTMMNSFLFNVMILLVCTVAAIQLCTIAFRQFAASSAISHIFVYQVQYLKYLNLFYSLDVPVFYSLLLAVAMLHLLWSLVCCLACPKRQADSVDDAMIDLRRDMRD
jgi:LMBR1 domain-containing protein 1